MLVGSLNITSHSRLLNVRKVQRKFAVEYRSGRRKAENASNSIWGNIDLKTVAQDVQQEVTSAEIGGQPGLGVEQSCFTPAEEDHAKPSLTLASRRTTTVEATGEAMMADENPMLATDAEQSADAELTVAKRPRKPRTKRVSESSTSEGVAASPTVGRKKRGRRPKDEATKDASPPARRQNPKKIGNAPVAPVTATDEMADLIQLEQENQRLRRLLAEKLRAENADLRKRLNLD